jgi:hypothetical protein
MKAALRWGIYQTNVSKTPSYRRVDRNCCRSPPVGISGISGTSQPGRHSRHVDALAVLSQASTLTSALDLHRIFNP